MKYKNVFVAGTFDAIHKGHEALLKRAFAEGSQVTIGLTPDEFVKKFKKENVRDFETRKKELQKRFPQASIIPIQDVHDPAASMPELDAIVVSTETAFRAGEINELRRKRHLHALAILEVAMVPAEDKQPISSTRMRNGEIDHNGRLIMPDSMRDELAQPLGMVLSGSRVAEGIENHKQDSIITVGDIATETVLRQGITPRLAIIDNRVGRKPHPTSVSEDEFTSTVRVASGPGYIAREAVDAIRAWAKKPQTTLLIVDGEEDLLALPAIAHAPPGSIVYYGQPQQEGLVEVVVTPEKKRSVVELLSRFT